VTTLFHYGAFGAHDVWMTRQAVIAYSVGLLGLILVKVLAPGFYARQNIATPVRIALLTLFTTQLLNAVLVGPLAHAGLALAISLGACLNAGLLYRGLRRHGIYQPQPGWPVFFAKVMFAVTAMGAAVWAASGPASWWLAAHASMRGAAVSGLVALGALVYFGALWLCGIRVRDFAGKLA
jgi:putative peptidoglycan lipid II flippase